MKDNKTEMNLTHREIHLDLDCCIPANLRIPKELKCINIGTYDHNPYIKSVHFYGSKKIGNWAFYKSKNLSSVTFENCIEFEIGSFAFAHTNLTDFIFPQKTLFDPNTVGVFNGCSNMEYIFIPESWKDVDRIDLELFIGNCPAKVQIAQKLRCHCRNKRMRMLLE